MKKKQLRQYLFTLLTRREYSEWELRNKLSHMTSDQDLVDEIIHEFQINGWQSDERFIKTLIDSKKYKYGPLKLKYDLNHKGIKDSNFEYLLPDNSTQLQVAINLLYKKYKTAQNTAEAKQKYFRFLQSKGFDNEITYTSINQFTQKK
ncbi:MAG: recombination regulator RecX [Neisseriaceae bacterium]|nr:MAG: recombination regulator RecX [Neisseriaceae bacterium]